MPLGRERSVYPYPRCRGWGGGATKIYSERLFLKYLVSDHGLCFGVDMKEASYLFLLSSRGVRFERRPVGDTVVEDLDYEIPQIVRALAEEHRSRDRTAS